MAPSERKPSGKCIDCWRGQQKRPSRKVHLEPLMPITQWWPVEVFHFSKPRFSSSPNELLLRAGSRHLRYIYRPVLLDGCLGAESRGGKSCFELGTGDMLQLPGFGVEMAIKNMEYSALDEKQVCGRAELCDCPGRYQQARLCIEGRSAARCQIAEEKAASESDSGLEEQLPGGEDPLASSLADEELKVSRAHRVCEPLKV